MKNKAAQALGRLGGSAAVKRLTPGERSERARKRWANVTEEERKAHGQMLAEARKAKKAKGGRAGS